MTGNGSRDADRCPGRVHGVGRLITLVLMTPLAWATCPSPVLAQGGAVRLVTLDSTAVRPVLRQLWERSVQANRELVACLGGRREGDRFRITTVAALESLLDSSASGEGFEGESDSVSVGERLTGLSVETCRPPQWVGTVHTHGARQEELRYPKFSSFDRTVISLWHGRWRHESVFCVLFDESRTPYCEHQAGAERQGRAQSGLDRRGGSAASAAPRRAPATPGETP